jgi:biotin synthase
MEIELHALAEEISQGRRLHIGEALALTESARPAALSQLADFLRRHFHGNRADLCSIINAKAGKCSENCAFCAQSAHHQSVADSYDCVDADAAMAMAKENQAAGVARFSLVTAGRELSDGQLARCIAIFKRLAAETTLSLCASMGFLTLQKAARLYAAGVRRYHCNLETSREFFPRICTSHRWDDKIATLAIARAAGLELCSGGIIGMGESRRDRLQLAISLREIGVNSIPINILAPIPGTPLANVPPLPHEEILLTIAMFVILAPEAVIRMAGGRALLGDRQENCFRAGAGGAIVGNYLTTLGRDIASDKIMLARLGFPDRIPVQEKGDPVLMEV